MDHSLVGPEDLDLNVLGRIEELASQGELCIGLPSTFKSRSSGLTREWSIHCAYTKFLGTWHHSCLQWTLDSLVRDIISTGKWFIGKLLHGQYYWSMDVYYLEMKLYITPSEWFHWTLSRRCCYPSMELLLVTYQSCRLHSFFNRCLYILRTTLRSNQHT